jgi:hypothetical protein
MMPILLGMFFLFDTHTCFEKQAILPKFYGVAPDPMSKIMGCTLFENHEILRLNPQ